VVGKLEVFVFGDLLRAAAEQSFQGFTAVAHPVLERDSDLRHRFCQSNEHLKAASCHRLLKKLTRTHQRANMVVRADQNWDEQVEIAGSKSRESRQERES